MISARHDKAMRLELGSRVVHAIKAENAGHRYQGGRIPHQRYAAIEKRLLRALDLRRGWAFE